MVFASLHRFNYELSERAKTGMVVIIHRKGGVVLLVLRCWCCVVGVVLLVLCCWCCVVGVVKSRFISPAPKLRCATGKLGEET